MNLSLKRVLVIPVLLALAMSATIAGFGNASVSAAEVERTCTYTSAFPGTLVEWDVADAKRVHVRADSGWLTMVEPPATSANVDRETGYFIRVKLTNGERVDIPCTFKPRFEASIAASAEPVCSVRESNIGPFFNSWNTIGSLNLRDEDGWVAKLDKNEPYRNVAELKDSYVVVNRNPVLGKLTTPCMLGQVPLLDAVYGGEKTREPGLAPVNGGWEVVVRSPEGGIFAIENRTTGVSRWVSTGFIEVGPTAVSADGSIFLLEDSDRPIDDVEVHLDTAAGQLTYYTVIR